MIVMFLKYQFAGLWPLLWHFGLGGIIVVACVVLYAFTPVWLSAFFPNIRKILIWVASVTVAVMISVAVGVTIGERRIQAQWDQAKANALETGQKARASAVRSVARKPSRLLPNHGDGYDRDR
jgi:hypothetical protein